MITDPSKMYLTHKDIKISCLDIIRQMEKSEWKPKVVVGITRGGLLPAMYISQWYTIPMYTVKIQLADSKGQHYDDATESACDLSEDAYNKKNILVIDDINDSGRTLEWLKKDWQGSSIPQDPRWETIWHKTVRFATIVDKETSVFNVDYHVIKMLPDQDKWVVFPWETWWKDIND